MVLSEGYYGFLKGWQHRRHSEVNLSTIPDLQGKVAVVTGANSGIGKVATQVLASKGAKVFMACRSRSNAEDAMTEIRSETPLADLHFLPYDGSSLCLAYESGLAFLKNKLPLDVLLLNAGVILSEPTPSKDGLESTFAVNHLAHFIFTIALSPALEQAAKTHHDVKISVTVSAGFALHPDPASLHTSEAELQVDSKTLWWMGDMPNYGRSKTCQILFVKELNRRLRNQTSWSFDVRVNAVHPGTVSTGLNLNLTKSWYVACLEWCVYAFAAIPSDAGAINMLYAATAAEIKDRDITGKYLTPYGFINTAPDGTAAGDMRLAESSWEDSLKLCRQCVPQLKVPNWIAQASTRP